MAANLLARKETAFVLWRVGNTNQPPTLIIGQLHPGTPITFSNERRFTLQPVAGFPELFEIPAADCNLTDGQVYHYWFEVDDTKPGHPAGQATQRNGVRVIPAALKNHRAQR